MPPPALASGPAVAPLLERLRAHLQSHKVQLASVFRPYSSTTRLTYAQLREALHSFAFVLAPTDFFAVCSQYDADKSGLVDFRALFRDTVGGDPFATAPSTPRLPPLPVSDAAAPADGGAASVLQQLQSVVLAKQINLRPFCQAFDRLRSGQITSTQLRRSIDQAGLRVNDTDFNHILAAYASPSLPGHVEWIRFADDLEAVVSARGLERHPRHKFVSTTARELKQGTKAAAPSHETRLRKLLSRMHETVQHRRILVDPAFVSADKANRQVISVDRFQQVLSFLSLLPTRQEELDLLLAEFGETVDGAAFVRYRSFIKRLESADQPLINNAHLDMLEGQLRDKLMQHIRGGAHSLHRAFRVFDKDGSGEITLTEFSEVLQHFMLEWKPEEVGALFDRYDTDSDGSIDFKEFIAQFLPQDYIEPAAAPSAEPVRVSNIRFDPPVVNPECTQIEQLLPKLQARALDTQLRPAEFFRDHDPLRSGFITTTRFRRGLDQAGLRVTDKEFSVLADRYAAPPSRPGEIAWQTFARDIDDAFVPRHMEKTPRIEPNKTAKAQLVYASNAPAERPDLDNLCSAVLDRMQDHIAAHRMSLHPVFVDFDKHHVGRVTRHHFETALAILGLPFNDLEVSALAAKFGEQIDSVHYVRYVDLIERLRSRDRNATDIEHLNKLERILREKVLQSVQGGPGQLRKAFRKFDRDGFGRITESQFAAVCRQYGLELSEEEVKGLMRRYDTDQDRAISYNEFVDRLMPADYAIPKRPVHTVNKAAAVPEFLPRKMNSAATTTAQILAKIKHLVVTRDIRPAEYLADFDRLKTGAVTPAQFRRALSMQGFALDDAEADILVADLARPDGLVNYRKFLRALDDIGQQHALERTPRAIVTQPNPRQLVRDAVGSAPDRLEQVAAAIIAKLRKAVVNMRKEVEAPFLDFDAHHVHRVSRTQFEQALSAVGLLPSSQSDVDVLVAKYGDENHGTVTVRYLDFLNDMYKPAVNVDQLEADLRKKLEEHIAGGSFQMRRAFKYFDKDGSGEITADELKEVLYHFMLTPSDDEIAALISRYDTDNDGSVDFHEFISAFLPQDYSGTAFAAEQRAEEATAGQELAAQRRKEARQRQSEAARKREQGGVRTVNAILASMRKLVDEKRIRVGEFLRDYDRLRCGAITRDQFQRGLGAAGVLPRDEEDFFTIVHAFDKDGKVKWSEFLRTLEEGEQQDTPDAGAAPQQDLAGLNDLLARIAAHVQRFRLIPKAAFMDYDRTRSGKISKAQFRRVCSFLNMAISDADASALFAKFETAPDRIDYVAFSNLVS